MLCLAKNTLLKTSPPPTALPKAPSKKTYAPNNALITPGANMIITLRPRPESQRVHGAHKALQLEAEWGGGGCISFRGLAESGPAEKCVSMFVPQWDRRNTVEAQRLIRRPTYDFNS